MHHSEILNHLRRQPNWKAKPLELKRKIDLDLPVGDPEIAEATICEEIDYLLMARLIIGNDVEGYQLSWLWRQLPAEIQAEWTCYGSPLRERPELDDPASIHRRWTTPYKWESNNWFSFEFACGADVEDGDFVVAIVSGLAKYCERMERSILRERFGSVLSRWYATPEGIAAWRSSCADFNIGDLAGAIGSESLVTLFSEAGVKNLQIVTAAGNCWWQHDDVLGKPPGFSPE